MLLVLGVLLVLVLLGVRREPVSCWQCAERLDARLPRLLAALVCESFASALFCVAIFAHLLLELELGLGLELELELESPGSWEGKERLHQHLE